MSWRTRSAITSSLVLSLLTAVASAAPAVPEKLTLNDLPSHPERWPATVSLKEEMKFVNGVTAPAGKPLPLLEMQGTNAVLDAGNNTVFAVGAADCDVLEAANKAWSALTPAERAVDATSLENDASLWPEQVTCKIEFGTTDGRTLPPGTVYDVGPISRGEVMMSQGEPAALIVTAKIGQTDLIARARERAKIEPDKRSSRIVETLKTRLIGPDGKPADTSTLDASTVFVFYVGAGWCGPCRTFAPTFVKYVDSVRAANPKMTVVMLNYDEKPAEMLAYMKEEAMTFPAVPKTAMVTAGALRSYPCGSIPQIIVTDRFGKVLANNYMGGAYTPPAGALAQLKKIVATGIAK